MAGFGSLGGLGSVRGAVTPLTGEEMLQMAQGNGGARLQAYHPSIRDRIGYAIYDAVGGLGGLGGVANGMRDDLGFALDLIPGLGAVLAGDDAKRSMEAGDYLSAGLNLAGAIPAGKLLGKAGEKLARGAFELDYFGQPVRILQNPSPQQIEGFLNRTKYKAARRIHNPETGETYIWDANDPALHQLVAEKLGIEPNDKLIMDIIGSD